MEPHSRQDSASSLPLVSTGLLDIPRGSWYAEAVEKIPYTTILADFEIVGKIGRGGIGEVFKARKKRTGSVSKEQEHPFVALKKLRGDLPNPRSHCAIFEKEIALQLEIERRLRQQRSLGTESSRMVSILEVGRGEGGPFFTMPLMERGSLADELRRREQWDQEALTRLLCQVAQALAELHRANFVHKDIKPANILLNSSGDAFLADFGCAYDTSLESVLEPFLSDVVGTVPFMSLQAVQGDGLDRRSDIYSLGAVIYFCLSGQPPYSGTDARSIIEQIKEGPPPSIFDRDRTSSPFLRRVAELAMAREFRDRYATSDDVASDLSRIAHGLKPLGRSQSDYLSQRNWFLIQRGCMLVLALCLVLLAWPAKPKVVQVSSVAPPAPLTGILNPQFGSWHPDAAPEIFVSQQGGVYVSSVSGELLPSTILMPEQRTNPNLLLDLMDINGDGLDEIFLFERVRESLFLSIRNENNFELGRFHTKGKYEEIKDVRLSDLNSRLKFPMILDFENDRRKELVTIVHTGNLLSPRGVVCFDLESGTNRWEYLTASQLGRPLVMDLDGDGVSELIVAGAAPSNGSVGPDGSRDHSSYVIALDSRGQRRWMREVGHEYTYPALHTADLNGDGEKELIYSNTTLGRSVWSRGQDDGFAGIHTGASEVAVLGTDGRVLVRRPIEKSAIDIQAADIDSDGRDEVLVSTLEGGILLLEEGLVVSKRVRCPVLASSESVDEVNIYFDHIGDLNLDQEPEIVARVIEVKRYHENVTSSHDTPGTKSTYHHSRIELFDGALRRIGRFVLHEETTIPYGYNETFVQLSSGRYPQLIFVGDKIYRFEFR